MQTLDLTPVTAPSTSHPRSIKVRGGWTNQSAVFGSSHSPEGTFYTAMQTPYAKWSLERGEAGFTAADTVTDIFGTGPTPNDAIVDLVQALKEHRALLERLPQLSADLQRQLAYLRRRS